MALCWRPKTNDEEQVKSKTLEKPQEFDILKSIPLQNYALCTWKSIQIPLVFHALGEQLKRHKDLDGIFRIAARQQNIQNLLNRIKNFDNDTTVDAAEFVFEQFLNDTHKLSGIPAIASVFKKFLRDLPEPLLPTDILQTFDSSEKFNVERIIQEFNKMPTINFNTCQYLFNVISTIVNYEGNKMDKHACAIIIAPNILPPSVDIRNDYEAAASRQELGYSFVEFLIEKSSEFFDFSNTLSTAGSFLKHTESCSSQSSKGTGKSVNEMLPQQNLVS